jgi:hypothetical protein
MTIIRHTLTRFIQIFAQRAVNFGNCFEGGNVSKVAGMCFFTVMLSACNATLPKKEFYRSAVRRDVESYAIASCLAYQKQPYLKEQGDGWASAIVQRSEGDINALIVVAQAVGAEVSKGKMKVNLSDNGPKHVEVLPVAYCFEILDSPSIHAAVKKAIKKLTPSYGTNGVVTDGVVTDRVGPR